MDIELLSAVRAAGFEAGQIVFRYNSYVDAPDPSDALEFGTQGISLRAQAVVKAADARIVHGVYIQEAT